MVLSDGIDVPLDQDDRLFRENLADEAGHFTVKIFDREEPDQGHQKKEKGKKGENEIISQLRRNRENIIFVHLLPDG